MNYFESVVFPFFKSIQITDIIDVVLVAFIIYNIMKFLRQTRAMQLLKGVGILLIVMYLSDWLHLNVINFILITAMQVGATALLIVFQPELRRGLEHVGRSKLGEMFTFDVNRDVPDMVDEVCEAAANLAKTKTGALIVFERRSRLNDVLTGGTMINAEISAEIIENIFVPNTPLHDGAVIIRNGRIYMASTVLPLSSNKRLSKEFGTRHRAALGVSEVSDCVALVVSEETGRISVTMNGDMIRNLSVSSLHTLLNKTVHPEHEEKSGPSKIFKGRAKQWINR
ncbi:MAG: TIGR00159 family protein [Ruminococcaceae bacterium]|nr:TIGR00159 family protein [Oscillospiraceae bacterium]